METNKREHLIWSETAVPKRRLIQNDLIFYLILLLLVFGIIMLGNWLLKTYGIPRLYVQLSLYVLLFLGALFIYRRYLREYRYLMTDRVLSIDQVVGKKVRNAELIHLSDIAAITPGSWKTGKARKLCIPNSPRYLVLTVRAAGKQTDILISPSDLFEEKLMQQWKAAKK